MISTKFQPYTKIVWKSKYDPSRFVYAVVVPDDHPEITEASRNSPYLHVWALFEDTKIIEAVLEHDCTSVERNIKVRLPVFL